MNPCPCGYLGDPNGECHCTKDAVTKYRSRISGPLLDRVDMRVSVPRPPASALRLDAGELEGSAAVAKRVRDVRGRQMERAAVCNAFLDGDLLESCCVTTGPVARILERATDRFAMSVRAQRRVLRVARTIADMAGEVVIGDEHIAEALALRGMT